jgi:hypothetical protein
VKIGTLAVLALALAASPAAAQQMKTVDGLVINIGIVKAIDALHVDAQHGAHTGAHSSGMEHLLVSLADARSGTHIADAKIVAELKDPRGKRQQRTLMPAVTAGFPDYSEVFEFGWSGRYTLGLTVTLKGASKPVKTSFTVNRQL